MGVHFFSVNNIPGNSTYIMALGIDKMEISSHIQNTEMT